MPSIGRTPFLAWLCRRTTASTTLFHPEYIVSLIPHLRQCYLIAVAKWFSCKELLGGVCVAGLISGDPVVGGTGRLCRARRGWSLSILNTNACCQVQLALFTTASQPTYSSEADVNAMGGRGAELRKLPCWRFLTTSCLEVMKCRMEFTPTWHLQREWMIRMMLTSVQKMRVPWRSQHQHGPLDDTRNAPHPSLCLSTLVICVVGSTQSV